jgi:hypothetical protein
MTDDTCLCGGTLYAYDSDSCLDCDARIVAYRLVEGFAPAWKANLLGLNYMGPRTDGNTMVRCVSWPGDRKIGRILLTYCPDRRDFKQWKAQGGFGCGRFLLAIFDTEGQRAVLAGAGSLELLVPLAICRLLNRGFRLGHQTRPIPFVPGKAPASIDPGAFDWLSPPAVETRVE